MNLIKHEYKGYIYDPDFTIMSDGVEINHYIFKKSDLSKPCYFYYGVKKDYMSKKQFIDYIILMEKLTYNGLTTFRGWLTLFLCL